MPDLVKKLNAPGEIFIGIMWPDEDNTYRIEDAFQDLIRTYEPSIREGALVLLSSPKDTAQQDAPVERIAATSAVDIMTVLGWSVALYTVYDTTPEVHSILKDVIDDFENFVKTEGLLQALGFIVTNEPMLMLLQGFCQQCRYRIHQSKWTRQKRDTHQCELQEIREEPNKKIALKKKDQEESSIPERIPDISDNAPDRRIFMKPTDSITLRLRKAQEEGDTKKIQKILHELKQLRKEAKELSEKGPICVTT